MRSIAGWSTSWTGTWVAADAKTVRLSHGDCGITVTVSPGPDQPPYRSAPLLDGGTKRIENLPTSLLVDEAGRQCLEVEAGVPGLGPTYRLYAAVRDAAGLSIARGDVAVDRIVLIPNTAIGLYDDFDDDLGVPWAYPLSPLRWRAE
ncbi:hypothetical protein I0C86_24640 [Plantactinospora sp. S1510]|uniref:Uncharacterized protein n=1 Tax=Plantactinospora alkalitolerans TaxID=2789879 RepID=A0ABS0H0X6_9ACTN|nr:hypothetical protein [Plantactinospora alkalitolerans]MBF9132118.1 hypothetical protein [Plantactinospora alkalitolerans]